MILYQGEIDIIFPITQLKISQLEMAFCQSFRMNALEEFVSCHSAVEIPRLD